MEIIKDASLEIFIAARQFPTYLNKNDFPASHFFKFNSYCPKDLLVDELGRHSFECVLYVATAGSNRRSTFSDEYIKQVNFDLPVKLLRVLGKNRLNNFIYLGSLSEYLGSESRVWLEEEALNPITSYGRWKYEAGLELQKVGIPMGVKICHFRLASVYGPGESPERLIPKLIEYSNGTRPLALSSPNIVRNYVHVKDCIDWIASFLPHKGNKDVSGVINFSSDLSISNGDLVALAGSIVGRPIPVNWGRFPVSSADHFEARPSCNLRKKIGLTESISLHNGIAYLLADRLSIRS
jgi:nucleoside-diphosphate-sugar epimerase